ncbi:MAG: transcription antitermination factor NusB [Clostridia bacterium]|nr:transcription antitermination factor NusB [Clostridia bacterium]
MDRRSSREQAFKFLFENTFGMNLPEETVENAQLAREEKVSAFTKTLFDGVLSNLEKIDKVIDENLMGWKRERISRTALAVLRLAVYEIMFEEDTPNKVAANEAVELSKKYSTKEESAYINGILGTIITKTESAN